MKYATVCSGIGAPEQAWKPLGWECSFASEIEPFASAVHSVRHGTTNLGDMTKFKKWPDYATDLIIAGCPCQSFSVAGLRRGLADHRGNLTLSFLAILERYRPRWVVYENVPGLLSDKTGAFGAFLGGLGELGYGFAYRVLDAQYFGVAQRRRRVFVVGHLGDWRRAAAVLFERESLCGDSPPGREAGKGVSASLRARTKAESGLLAFQPRIARNDRGDMGDKVNALNSQSGQTGKGDAAPCVAIGFSVRRLTPTECERLQGFPDNFTAIPWRGKPAEECPDGPRYRVLGNSMAVPVVLWIGRRIEMFDRPYSV
jgi:DNA (cytosine-5)-methyltransferase 1